MKILEAFIDGFIDIRYHPGRTILQILGIILGVASIVVTYALTYGMKQESLKYYEKVGGLKKVYVGAKLYRHFRNVKKPKNVKLNIDDILFIEKESPEILYVEPIQSMWADIKNKKGIVKNIYIDGVGKNYFDLNGYELQEGRLFGDIDLKRCNKVAVIGYYRALEFFGSQSPVGNTIFIKGQGFTIVGLLKEKFFSFGGNRAGWHRYNALEWYNKRLLIPYTTMLKLFFKKNQTFYGFYVKLKNVDLLKSFEHRVKNLLFRLNKNVDDFQILSRKERIETREKENIALNIVFQLAGIISLIIGGVVIMNILLASFHEKIREVGIRKAIGATSLQIFFYFIVESVIITFIGGFAGIFLGIYLAKIVNYFTGYSTAFLWYHNIIALLFSVSVGIIFGFYPAVKAAKLNPIEAIRYE